METLAMDDPTPSREAPDSPRISLHFVNNVLATAASHVEDEPDTARDVLARLGAFLSHRLRDIRQVTLGEELDHVQIYVQLQQARFPGRIEAELPSLERVPAVTVAPGAVQAPLAEALERWLRSHPGRVRAALRVRSDAGVEVQFDRPDEPGAAGERVRIPIDGSATLLEATR